MKKFFTELDALFTVALTIGCAAALLSIAGCAPLDRALLVDHVTITPALTNIATGEITPAVTNHDFSPAPQAQAGATLLGSLPLPWCGTAGAALTALLTMYANARNKKLASALVTGIEAGRQILQTTPEGQALDVQIKAALIDHQEVAGVLNEAGRLVNNLTGKTTT